MKLSPTPSRTDEPRAAAPRPAALELPPGRALALPCAFAVALVVFALLTPIRQHPQMLRTFLVAGGALLLWGGALWATARRAGRRLTLEVAIRKHHWVQACAQIVVLLYWGWYARFVYAFIPLIVAQLVFAYAVDGLLAWSRRDRYALGFGPFPIILSINLFLWFKPEWFHWQFAMIALGYLAKEFIRWNREGRSAHIFNPSSFPLAVLSIGLILTEASGITLGVEIANTQFDPPHIYLVIFLAALPGQLLFGVARQTMPAVVTMYAVSLLYFKATGTYLFFDSHIPLPVFLGMHLLFTDPSTSPRSEGGQLLFGILYGLGTTACFVALGALGTPTFYDKLLPVPLMNLMVRRIDRLVAARPLAALDPARLARGLTPRQRHVAYAGLWAGIFVAMSGVQGVGDRHPGQYLPFWEEACRTGSTRACDHVVFSKFVYCNKGSGWACNEWGLHMAERRLDRHADSAFQRACELGFSPACGNIGRGSAEFGALARDRPPASELRILLGGTKRTLRERDPDRLTALACAQGWQGTCEELPAKAQP